MSMTRVSGAIPAMTALQMATASFAVPKSVMKTIVDRAAAPACSPAPLPAGVLPHPERTRIAAKRGKQIRFRKCISSPKLDCVACRSRVPEERKEVYRKDFRADESLPRSLPRKDAIGGTNE